MKLNLKLFGLQHPSSRRIEPSHPLIRSQRPVNGDGFAVAQRRLVDLGRLPPASAAADAAYVRGLYQELLGREPDPEGFHSHLRGLETGMSRDEIRQVFLTSPEYRSLQAARQVTPEAPVEAPPAAPAPTTGDATKLGPVPLEGFDSRKLSDPAHRTPKYLFGRVATHFGLESVKDKAGAEALLNKMVPDLIAAGLDVRGVKGDKLLLKTDLGLEAIDVVRGAGSGSPGWWWGADGTVASPEEIAKFPPLQPGTRPTPPVQPGPSPQPAGLTPLSTIPNLPEYAQIPVDRSSPEAAVLSAARWVREHHPDLFARATDRQVCFDIMTKVIGALRANGYDATRVVNHPSIPVGQGMRYGSDAVALNGRIFDVYVAMGEEARPVANDVGPYESGRLPE